MSKYYSVAIDGPSGAGKSTIAKAAAKALGFVYLDTGAIYRTVAWHITMMGIGPKDTDHVPMLLDDANIKIDFREDGQHMILNGKDITGELRTPEISACASQVAALSCVRDSYWTSSGILPSSITSSWTAGTSAPWCCPMHP